MAISASVMAAATVANTAYSVYSGQKSTRMQKNAARTAAQQAEAQQRQSQREFNRMNQKSPNIAAIMTRNRAASSGGPGGTFLTGMGGAPVSGGMLGRTSVLGS